MKIVFKSLFLLLILISSLKGFSQDNFKSKYALGKDLIKQGRYTAAMEILKPLTAEAQGNSYVQYSHYMYSLAALKAKMLLDANFMLKKLIEKYPNWEKMEEVYYLLGNVDFELKKYSDAQKHLEGRKKDLKNDIDKMKSFYYGKINSIDTLTNLQREYPADPIIANALAKKLSSSIMNEKQRMLLEYLVQEYKLDRQKFVSGKESVTKASYNVAVLFPFMLKDLNPNSSTRSNQFVFDMYEGISMAVDSLKRKGVSINLFAYDTEKDDSKVPQLLTLPEMKNMDMIIGTIYPSYYSVISEFGLKNQILVINPLSNNAQVAANNSFTLLFQPSLQSIAGQAAKYASSYLPKDEKVKNVIIFQSPTPKDSLLANNFADSSRLNGFQVKYHEILKKDNISRVQEILKDSMMMLTVSHVFVSSTDQVLAANIISAMEISRFTTPIITSSEWLQFSLLTYAQFERRNVLFLNEEFIDYKTPAINNFRKAYISRTNTLPTSYTYQGYELMQVFGKSLGKYGNYFVNGLQKENFIPGLVFQGFNYSNGNSNSFVPIVKFVDSQLTVVNNPQVPYIDEKKR